MTFDSEDAAWRRLADYLQQGIARVLGIHEGRVQVTLERTEPIFGLGVRIDGRKKTAREAALIDRFMASQGLRKYKAGRG